MRIFFPVRFSFENDRRGNNDALGWKKKKKEKEKKQHLHTRIDPTATDYNPVIRRREYDLRRFSLSLSLLVPRLFLVFFLDPTRVKRK